MLKKLMVLEDVLLETKETCELVARACFYRDQVFPAMAELRLVVDELEMLVAKKHWPLPSYAALLYSAL